MFNVSISDCFYKKKYFLKFKNTTNETFFVTIFTKTKSLDLEKII